MRGEEINWIEGTPLGINVKEKRHWTSFQCLLKIII